MKRVLLNEQASKWTNTLARVPQGSLSGFSSVLIYINNLPDGSNSICKIFADDTSLFSKIKYLDTSNIGINYDLVKIRWACQWHEKSLFRPFIINSSNILSLPCQKHLDIVLDSKLTFN